MFVYLLFYVLKLGCKNIIFTGVAYSKDTTGVVVYENGEYSYYKHSRLANGCHGTGDIYASAFTGALVRGKGAYTSAKIAADYVLECIKETQNKDENEEPHWYGAKFETALRDLMDTLQ